MDYSTNEMNGLILPAGTAPTKEFYRVMGINSREIYCVYEIDPDVTLHPTGIKWDVNGVHKWLPFKTWAGVHGLTITGEERATKELNEKAPERKAKKEAIRLDKKLESNDIEEFYNTPVGERKVIHDTMTRVEPTPIERKEEDTEEVEVAQAEITKAKRGRAKK